jgi:hypothetical protein
MSFLGLALTSGDWAEEGQHPDWREVYPPLSYWSGIVTGGPIMVGLHLAIVLAFVASIIATVRHASPLRSLSLSIAPFVFGSIAMWFGIWGLDNAVSSFSYETDVYRVLPVLPRPFYLSGICTVVSVAFLFLFRGVRKREMPANSQRFDY